MRRPPPAPRPSPGSGPLLSLLVAVALAPGCGPVSYLATVTVKASRVIAEARASGAEERAPYEYWSAVAYLEMAREKFGPGDYELARSYGRKAIEMGRLARQRASEVAEGGGAAAAPAATEGAATPKAAPAPPRKAPPKGAPKKKRLRIVVPPPPGGGG